MASQSGKGGRWTRESKMINIKPWVERPFWTEMTSRSIGDYLKQLKLYKKRLHNLHWDIRDLVSERFVEKVVRAIETEIAYCEFYFELRGKMKFGKFKKWEFTGGYKRYDWNDPVDKWEISNGKVKLIIEIKKGEKSTWVKHRIENDSKFLHFVSDHGRKELSTKILRSEESVKGYVEELKTEADMLFGEHDMPTYSEELRNLEFLKHLLDVA